MAEKQKTLNDTVAESMLGAMDIVVQKALSDLQFDKTYQPCKIIQRADDEENKYVCEYENKRFEAYSDQSFFADDLVQVLVPQNNWSNQKTIVGRVMLAGSAAYNFKYPFDDFIVVGQMDVEDLYSLLAGCAPVAVSTINALTNQDKYRAYPDLPGWIKAQEGNQTGSYIFGHTPYSINLIMDEIEAADIAAVAGYAKRLIIFDSTAAVISYITNTEHDSSYVRNYFTQLQQTGNTYYWTLETLQNELKKCSIKLAGDTNQELFPVGPIGELNKANAEAGISEAISLVTAKAAELSATWDQDTNTTERYSFVVLDANGAATGIVNKAGRVAMLNNLTNLRNIREQAWLEVVASIVDWTLIDRDLSYAEFVERAVKVDETTWDTYVEAWLAKKKDEFRERTMETVYNQYRMTAICGGPDNKFKFWANRHFKDRLNDNHYNLPRMKLCSFVPANGAKSIQGFTRAGLSLDVTSLLNGQRVIKGEYGVYIQIEGSRATETDTETTDVMTQDEYNAEKAKLDAAMAGEIAEVNQDNSMDAVQKQDAINAIQERYKNLYTKLAKNVVVNETEDASTGATTDIRFDDQFSSATDFYGNVYAYVVPYTQQKLLNISNFISISRVTLYVYQSFDTFETVRANLREIANNIVEKKRAIAALEQTLNAHLSVEEQTAINEQLTPLRNELTQLREDYKAAQDSTERNYGWEREGNDRVVTYKRAKDGYVTGEDYAEAQPDDIVPEYEDELPENLGFEKPYLGLGFSAQELKDGKLIMYTMDDLSYGALGTTSNPEEDARNLKLVWVQPENDILNIYPTWKPGKDPNGVQQDKVELQPWEYDLFYRREQADTFEKLKTLYKQKYDHPYDSARAQKQQQVAEALTTWITILRNSIDNAKQYYLRLKAQNQLSAIQWERIKAELVEQDAALKRQVQDISSIGDLSILGDNIAKTQRVVDYYRGKISELLRTQVEAQTPVDAQALKEKIDQISSALQEDIIVLQSTTPDKLKITQKYQELIGSDTIAALAYEQLYRQYIAEEEHKDALAVGAKGSAADFQTASDKLMHELEDGAKHTLAQKHVSRMDAIMEQAALQYNLTGVVSVGGGS